MHAIASSVPGRMRIRHAGLRLPEAARLVPTLAVLPGVEAVQHNPRVGSLLITYDVARLPEAELVSLLSRYSAALADREIAEEAPLEVSPRLITASLAGTLGLTVFGAIAGQKRLHVAAGMLFLASVGGHVLMVRKGKG